MSQIQNPKDHNSSGQGMLVAIVLCIAFYFGWTQYLNRKYPDHNKKPVVENTVAPQEAAGTTTPSATTADTGQSIHTPVVGGSNAPKAARMAPSDLVYESSDAIFTFDQDLGSMTNVKLKGYKENNKPDSPSIELFQRPLVVQATVQAAAQPGSQATLPTKPQAVDYEGAHNGNEFKFVRQEGPWKITQTWTLPTTGFAAKLNTEWTNTSSESQNLKASVLFEMGSLANQATSSFFAPGTPSEASRFLTQIDGSDDFKHIQSFCEDQALQVTVANKKLDFFGFDHHYFAAAFVPKAEASYRTGFSTNAGGICTIVTNVSSDLGTISAGQSASMSWDAWFGPKEVELLTNFNPRLRTTLGLGWLDMIAHPLLLAIKGLYKFTGNYGIAIILLTLLLKILFYPLAKQAAVSAARMKKYNPEMTKLREKYKQDPQRMQMELMKFMSQHKINPMKGCLPMLPTIPVFFALFRVLSASIDLRHAPFYGWITDLSAKDPYFVTPIILTVCMFIQQKMTPMTGMDPTQEKVMMMMPIIFGVMMISLPSGLVLYMLTNTIFTIVQQHLLNKKLADVA